MQADQINCLNEVVKRDKNLHKGENIYRAGERFTGIYALKSGTAKLVYADRQGNETIISLLLPGELLGFDGLSTRRYLCSLTALETISFCELPARDLDHLVQTLPGLHRIILQRTGDQFQQSIHRMIMSQRPAEERMATFLFDLSSRYGKRGFSAAEFHLSLTRQEIGDYLGLALETVSRLLSRFESLGTIRVQGKLIQIVDADSLRRLVKLPSHD